MSLQKIGNLTNAVNTLKKKSGTGKDIISTLSSFGDLSTAAKYLVSTNKKGEKTLSEKTLFNLLKGAYGNLGEEAISEALKQGIKTSSIKGALSSGISGLVSGIGAAGTGLVSFLGSIWPLLAVGGGIFAGVKGYQALNDKFTLTKGMADKHYSQSTQEYADNQSELESLQSQRDSNQERIYELRAKENKSTDEKAELSQLQEENNLLNSQVAIKEKSVDVSKLQAANDAKTKLEKKGYQNPDVLNNIEKIDAAMSKENKHVPEKISFKYLKYSISNLNQQVERRHGSRYEVSPYALLINDGNYYLLAYNDYIKGLRTYRVDRMKDVKLLGIEREGKEVFNKINLKNYTQRVFSMFGGEQERITIQFINSLLDAVVDRFGKKGMLYNVVDDKHFSITAPVEISDQFYGWVLGFGNKAKILKSQKVVDGFTEYLDKIRKTYES